ncbi:MAG: hypothetical protein V4507_08325 [Verrucomicrobiota bacterium]
MARRASAQQSPIVLILVLLVVVGLGVGGFFIFRKNNEPFRTHQSMDVGIYLENANSLRGNTYKVEAVIQNSLAWAPARGRLFSVEVDVSNGKEMLPLLIPAELNNVNVQKGQRYFFKIEVVQDGVLLVKEMTKA